VAGVDWSQKRFDGITGYFVKAGCANGVRHFPMLAESMVMPEIMSKAGLGDDEILRIVAAGRTSEQLRSLKAEWMAFRENTKDKNAENQYNDRLLLRNLKNLKALIAGGFDKRFFDGLSIGALQQAGDRVFEMSLIPPFKQALVCKDITAWVCDNDATAFKALDFLKAHNKRVPAQISVVGFDNVPSTALERGLTTFDFNAAGFVRRMLSFIIRPPRPRGPHRHQTIEVEGIVIERNTTARAGKTNTLMQ
jgi:hypothetical protein